MTRARTIPCVLGLLVLTAAPPWVCARGRGETPVPEPEASPLAANGAGAESVLARADKHFQLGKAQLSAGRIAAARQEFDRAVDVLLEAPESLRAQREFRQQFEQLVEAIHRYDLAAASDERSQAPAFDKPPLEDIPEPTFPVDPSERDRVLEQIRATASQLPLEVNDDVLRYIRYFSTARGRKILIAGLRRAGRYRELIYRILDEEGLPRELIHLAQAESGFLPRAVSRKKATGMWQFMLFRGRQYGLARDKYVDERMDPEKATRAAARHLRDLYTQFGDWYLAMAAYNCGPGVVERAVERTGYADIWELRRRNVLPRETSNYIPIILAMIIMAKNPAAYGLEEVEPDPPVRYEAVEITAPTSLQLVADITGAPVELLRELNPALLTPVAPAGYSLRVPHGEGASVASVLRMIPPEGRGRWRMHRVAGGETLAEIARRYRARTVEIAALNRLDGAPPEPGTLLLVPTRTAPQTAFRRPNSRKAARSSATRRGGAPARTAAP
ncbi:MAG: transglycosylase SLT domain-containing protein [Bryobacterales bacterium]|nr:transglycosylase SLT domain-containing protein [Bryobacteraceae bacterium]MDW8356165.1 transglycosylase SLT domain-containing protein [Bryobacterales bacterium]